MMARRAGLFFVFLMTAMEIIVDLRVLLKQPLTGVGLYTAGLLTALLKSDQHNFYKLFINGLTLPQREVLKSFQQFSNAKLYSFHYPNKFLNGSLAFLKRPHLDKLAGGSPRLSSSPRWRAGAAGGEAGGRIFWFPNLNFWSVTPACQAVVTVHDLSFERIKWAYSAKMRLWHELIGPKEKLRSAAKVIAVSESTKRDLMDIYRLPENKIEVIYPGIESQITNLSRAEPRDHKSQITKDDLPEKYILFLGTLEPRKNVEGVIRAFELLNRPDYHLVIAGVRGWLYRKIYQAARRSPLKARIRFIDYIEPEARAQLYQKAALLVWPSFYEGFGLPPLEAMADSCPVITSANSSLPETTRGAALLVNPYNIREIALAMKMVLTDNDLRQNLINKGYQVVQNYSWQKSAEKMLNIFNSLIKN